MRLNWVPQWHTIEEKPLHLYTKIKPEVPTTIHVLYRVLYDKYTCMNTSDTYFLGGIRIQTVTVRVALFNKKYERI